MTTVETVDIDGQKHVPLRERDDFFRLLGAFSELGRCSYKANVALGRALQDRDRIPKHHRRRHAVQDRIIAPLRELAKQYQDEIARLRPIVHWESQHGHHDASARAEAERRNHNRGQGRQAGHHAAHG